MRFIRFDRMGSIAKKQKSVNVLTNTHTGTNGDTKPHPRVINKKTAVTTPDNREPALPVVWMFITHCISTRAFCSTKVKAPTAQMRVEALDWCG